MKTSSYKAKKSTPYFYYPQIEDTNYLLSYEEVNEIKSREGGELLFADLKMSFSQKEVEKNYQKVEDFIAKSMTNGEKKEFSNYSQIKDERVLESTIDDKYWVSAILDVWSLNCNKKNFDIKVGHGINKGYSKLKYRKKGNMIKDKLKSVFGNNDFKEVLIYMKDIKFNGDYSFECGVYKYSVGSDHLEMRKRESNFTPLIIGLESGYTYGKKGEKDLVDILDN